MVMTDATHKTLSDGIERWKTKNFYLSMVKYIICNVLRILLYIAAYVMRKCSSLFENLSDDLKAIENAENSAEKTIKNRCDAYCLSKREELKEEKQIINNTVNEVIDKQSNSHTNRINKHEELKEKEKNINNTVNKLIDKQSNFHTNHINKHEELNKEKKIINNTVNELTDKQSNSYTNHINKNEQKEANNIGNVVNELIDNAIIENNGQSVFEHNIVTEQKFLNGVANIVNSTLNKESDSQISEESREHSNFEEIEEKVEEKNITGNVIESARVRKRFGIKNTAILLITKTIKENNLKDKRFKMENELNRNKMLNNGKPYRDKDEILTSKSDSFKRERESSLKNEPENTDCFLKVANDSCIKDTTIVSPSKYKFDSKNLDVRKNKESMKNERKMNGNENWVMKNNVDHWVNDVGNESKKPITKIENVSVENNDEHMKNINSDENKILITNTENVNTTINDEYWNNYNVCKNRESITKTENVIIKSKDESLSNNKGCENRKSIKKTENMTIKKNSEPKENNNSYEHKKSITKIEKMLNMFEVKDDIFGLPSKFSLAHCVCEDFHNSFGMTADFKFKFGNIGKLMDLNLRVSDVGHIVHKEQHIFYLVVKRKMSQKPLLSSLEIALYNLRKQMNDCKLTKLAISKYGFEEFNKMDVKALISKIFALSNIEITICLKSSKLEIEHINPPKINFTSKQLWEMEKQTDLIIFININAVYLDNWNDKVVEHINAKYPFKERLLQDINVKPVAAGDVLLYKIDTEVLFCIFIQSIDQHPSYCKSLEDAFQKMKSQLTGYRYLAIQQDPLNHKTNIHNFARNLAMLKSVFSNRNAEIWICGDTEQHNTLQYQQYKKTVTDTIDVSHKRHSKTSSRSKNKLDRKRHSINSNNSNTSKHDSEENHYCKNTPDVNAVKYLNQEEISINNYITENWDN
ncbi:protein PF14_0175-like isoform X3 [Rhopalosiphum maidis]|uniref:protein PF14_0175-like isoform X3 n=1 Tax=Rhopalosiphum maidis TaxID=43146 RepID=UPI000EFEF835|nr:protein PF14_0175-like isoform X3 [Rhopalosiphum maidis]